MGQRVMTKNRKQTLAAIRAAELVAYRNGAPRVTLAKRLDQQAQHILRMRYSLKSDALNRA
jgi:hypothetical protein